MTWMVQLSVGDFAISPGLQLEGEAPTLSAGIPWLVGSDLQLVVLVIPASGTSPAEKRLMSLSEVMCWVAQTRGVTECAMMDHDMFPMKKDYRVGFLPKTKFVVSSQNVLINMFKPPFCFQPLFKHTCRSLVALKYRCNSGLSSSPERR